MRLRMGLSSLVERLRASLFFIPMLAVIGAVMLGLGGIALDQHLNATSGRLPFGLTSTVESSRALLSTVAAATISFAGVAFSVSLLIIQLASSQYSPRVVHTLFRDPFNKRVMALVVGTFTYCVIILRSVRSPLDEGGEPVIPNLSVMVAVLLGIATILAVVASINHSAHSMDVSEILENIRREATVSIRREWSPAEPGSRPGGPLEPLDGPSCVVRFDRAGWVQQFDAEALLGCVPEGGVVRLETHPGRYAIEGTPFCTLSPPPADPDEVGDLCASITIGESRTMQQDVSYGLRQLADIALRALSPGINDPTTAQDAIFHAAAVLAEILRRDPPPRQREGTAGRRLVLAQQPTHDELIRLTFDEARRAAAAHPTVCIYLLEALDLLREGLEGAGLADRTSALVEQADLIMAGCEAAEILPADRQLVRAAHQKRFGAVPRPVARSGP